MEQAMQHLADDIAHAFEKFKRALREIGEILGAMAELFAADAESRSTLSAEKSPVVGAGRSVWLRTAALIPRNRRLLQAHWFG